MNKWLKTLLFLAGSALLTRFIPFSSLFRNLDTMFHEFGHALMTLLLSGHVLRIELYSDHSGVTYSAIAAGGRAILVSLAGYPLASLFALLLFYLYSRDKRQWGLILASLVALVMLVLYVRGSFGMIWLSGFILLNAAMLFLWPKVSKYYYLFLAFLTLEESVMGTLFLMSASVVTPSRAGMQRIWPDLRAFRRWCGRCCSSCSLCCARNGRWVVSSDRSRRAGLSEECKGIKQHFVRHILTKVYTFIKRQIPLVVGWLFFCRYYRTEHIFHDKELSAIIGTLIEDPKKERGGNMQASIQTLFTWSQDRILAGGAKKVVLLIEWKGVTQGEDFRKRSRKVAARDIELRVWLEGHVKATGCYGCTAEEGEGRSLLLKLGKIHAGQRRYIALEFMMGAMPAGIHEALWLQWQYKQPAVERIRELPLKKLGIEYSHHTELLGHGAAST